jgi:hypothetical protein
MATTPTHAIVVRVRFKPGSLEAATEILHSEVVPGAKSAPGFVTGYWMHDLEGLTGNSVELFDNLANAEAALSARVMSLPPEAPVTIESAAVVSVAAIA